MVPAAVVVLASIGEADTGEVEIGEVVAGGLVVELVVEELAVEELSGDGPKPGGGDKPVPKDPIELMDKSRFVGWREGANCLSLCKETLKKYGLSNYGSSLNVLS